MTNNRIIGLPYFNDGILMDCRITIGFYFIRTARVLEQIGLSEITTDKRIIG
jgi:hypothetical protein